MLPLREGSHSCPIELVVDGFEQLNLRQIEESAPGHLKGALWLENFLNEGRVAVGDCDTQWSPAFFAQRKQVAPLQTASR